MTSQDSTRPSLRLWPGVVAVALLWLGRFGLKAIFPGFTGFSHGMMATMACAAAIVLWWLFASRARWFDRLGGVALLAGGLGATWWLKHESMGPLWLIGYLLPIVFLAFVGALVAGRHLDDSRRRVAVAAAVLLACGGWLLARTEGIDGDHDATFAWRWSATAEAQLIAEAEAASPDALSPTVPVIEPAVEAGSTEPAAWPGFRGVDRSGIVPGTRIATDWTASPPTEVWRRPVGPGWSSFAVDGDRFYTEEQRGDDEAVSCYTLATGEPLWIHRDPVRFFESNAGAGPRATPTLVGGRVYAFGATGLLNVLDAATGGLVWTRDVAADTEMALPDWGFSSSPLVVGDLVVVAAAGQLAAYDRSTGDPRWTSEADATGYVSPHLARIDGVEQILLPNGAGTLAVAPADGSVLWRHDQSGFPMTQPAVLADGDVLVAASESSGVRRLTLRRSADGWTAEERWTSRGLKPYFNGFVAHEGHAYGFDGRILACIDLADGDRCWKGGRYGNGQLILLPDQDLLLVLTEKGELALVSATPEGYEELARRPAIEGKTWNHPTLVGDLLLVRNAEEMAAFRLSS